MQHTNTNTIMLWTIKSKSVDWHSQRILWLKNAITVNSNYHNINIKYTIILVTETILLEEREVIHFNFGW